MEICREFQQCYNYLGNIRNDTALNKIVAMAKTRELRDVERAIIKKLSLQGLSLREISRIVGCHYSTISRVLKKFKIEGTVQKSRSGRPKKLDPRGEQMVTRVAKCH